MIQSSIQSHSTSVQAVSGVTGRGRGYEGCHAKGLKDGARLKTSLKLNSRQHTMISMRVVTVTDVNISCEDKKVTFGWLGKMKT